MSTCYYPDNVINFCDLISRLKVDGRVTIETCSSDPQDELSPNSHIRLLMDGNYIHVYKNGDYSNYTRYGINCPDPILDIIGELFNVTFYDEYTLLDDPDLMIALGFRDPK